MTVWNTDLYNALIDAGCSKDKAIAAAKVEKLQVGPTPGHDWYGRKLITISHKIVIISFMLGMVLAFATISFINHSIAKPTVEDWQKYYESLAETH